MSILRCKVVFDQDFHRQPNQTLPPMNSLNNFHVQSLASKNSLKPLKIVIYIFKINRHFISEDKRCFSTVQ